MGKALDAMNQGLPPEAARFKALFLLVKSEGYPVEESWLTSWSKADREAIERLLRRSMEACQAPPRDLLRWRTDLERWIVAETEFCL